MMDHQRWLRVVYRQDDRGLAFVRGQYAILRRVYLEELMDARLGEYIMEHHFPYDNSYLCWCIGSAKERT